MHGPFLSFRGISGNDWNVSLLIVCPEGEKPKVTLDRGKASAARPLYTYKQSQVLRYDFAVPMTAAEQEIGYHLGPRHQGRFFVPPKGRIPRIAYASCNGFSDPALMKKIPDKNNLWKLMMHLQRLVAVRAEDAQKLHYHLLAMGGDQVYADPMWQSCPSLRKWSEQPVEKRRKAPFTSTMARELEQFFFDLYTSRWSQPEMQSAMGSIPTVMMWDDHDIFDGWGSYDAEDNQSPVYQGIFALARRFFRLFQQQLPVEGGETHPCALHPETGLSNGYLLGSAALLALDMRSERTPEQVLSPASWDRVYRWLDRLGPDCKHVFVMSSIPVVHPNFTLLEGLLGAVPGRQELEDDLKDHWHSRSHQGERLRLIHRLLSLATAKNLRVTLLSGDVHVAAWGTVESTRPGLPGNESRILTQLTSSGIVHPAPSGMVLLALELLARQREDIEPYLTAELQNFPGTRSKFIGSRNFLSIEPDDRHRLWVNWYAEDLKTPDKQTVPYTRVIEPAA